VKIIELAIARPVATLLLTAGLVIAGMLAFFQLSIAPIPLIDFPFISVRAAMPGASPEVMAASVATPLERHLGHIADVAEMSSASSQGSTDIYLQFGLSRNIDAAARDVQAAINAARADLPVSLRANPTYYKYNPGENPIIILALSSKTLTQGQLFDAATIYMQQKLAQVEGIGQVLVSASSMPGVRVELNPQDLFKYGIGFEDVRAALAATNANGPKGAIETSEQRFQIYANDQALKAEDYKDLIIAYRNGAPVRLSEVADIVDSTENLRITGLVNGDLAVQVTIYRQPGANMVETVDRIRALLPALTAALPGDIDVRIVQDRTLTIRTSLREVELSLLIAIFLVVLVVFIFLRDTRAAFIATITLPVSLIGTFSVMYLLQYTLDTLSLMALTIATGFVVDDAIVVVENVIRHREAGTSRFKAALLGTREVAFTVVSMSISLIAVFLPILFMGGLTGRMLREFAVTLSMTILVSLVLSLTVTPMLCARFLPHQAVPQGCSWFSISEYIFDSLSNAYRRSLGVALAHRRIMMGVLAGVIGLNVFLFTIIQKSFFPIQDTGRLRGVMIADQNISFSAMQQKLVQSIAILQEDPAVSAAVGSVGVSSFGNIPTNLASLLVFLKPFAERVSADEVLARLRAKTAKVPGAAMFLQTVQDLYVGSRPSNALYQYVLKSDDLDELRRWAPKLTEALRRHPDLVDVNSDQQDKGLQTEVVIDRPNAARLSLSTSQIDNTLYDAFGQRQVSTIFTPLSQQHVVMEVAPRYSEAPEILDNLFFSTSGGAVSGTAGTNAPSGTVILSRAAQAASVSGNDRDAARNQRTNQFGGVARGAASTGTAISRTSETMVPFSTFAHFGVGPTPLVVNHQGNSAAIMISFNIKPGKTFADAEAAIREMANEIQLPATIYGSFQGTAGMFQDTSENQLLLILAALACVYIVLGILYESFVHPVTILSTLPSAGLGALLALFGFKTDLSIIAMIGVLLLIGIVKKNAIMMVDFALDKERQQGVSAEAAIFEACLLRFRPILMTTLVALISAMPLALGGGEGAEIRRPLGLAIIGGLIVSQILTLYTTPIVYLYLNRFHRWRRPVRNVNEGLG